LDPAINQEEKPMTTQLNYTVAQQHLADLRHSAERARLTRDAEAGQRSSRDGGPMTRVRALLARLSPKQAATPLVGGGDC
jgi:hypothetical protein